MSDPLTLIECWPSMGQGNHSDATKRHHEWLKSLANTIIALQKKVEEQDQTIANQKSEIDRIKGTTSSSSSHPFSYSSMVTNNSKKSDAEIFIMSKVHAELKEKSKIENNVIVSGLDEPSSSDNENIAEKDEEIVDDLLESLNVSKNKVKRFTRLRKKGGKTDQTKPDLLLIEFTDNITQTKALSNAAKLRNITNYKKVFVNPDKTPTERAGEAKLRQTRNELNDSLQHGSGRFKYGIENNKRYYWGIRNGMLCKLEPKPKS